MLLIDITEIIEQRLHNLKRPNKVRTQEQIQAKSLKNRQQYEKRLASQGVAIKSAPQRQADIFDISDPCVQDFIDASKVPDDIDDPDQYCDMDVMGKVPHEGKTRMQPRKKLSKKAAAEALQKTASLQKTTSIQRTDSFVGRNRKGDRVIASMSLTRKGNDEGEDSIPSDDEWEDPNLFYTQMGFKRKKRDRRGQPLAGSSNGAIQVIY